MNTQRAADIAISFPAVVLPAGSIDLERWAVIACDQFTAEPEYWTAVAERVGTAPSTLHVILPEIYLREDDLAARTSAILETMQRYRDDGTLRTVPDSAVYVERTLGSGAIRRGLVVALDLEQYDYAPDSTAQIRASEETIPERLPPRMDIRRAAILESPHVMVLYDDPNNHVLSALTEHLDDLELLYDTPLMEGGGSVRGRRIPADSAAGAALVESLGSLDTVERYGFRYATGDGNHSLAAAKALWEEAKAAGAPSDDPRRWSLVELVNVYDDGLPFHPIHRLVAGDEGRLLDELLRHTDARFHGFPVDRIAGHIAFEGLSPNEVAFISPSHAGILTLPQDSGLPVGLVDTAIAAAEPAAVDYVHGFEEVVTAAEHQRAAAIVLPELARDQLFATVSRDGALPRKAFSLGEARDKRYYLECRFIDA